MSTADPTTTIPNTTGPTSTIATTARPDLVAPTFAADVRRMGALARAELVLFTRNTTAMVNAIAMPLLLVAVFSLTSGGALGLATSVVTMVTCAGLNFVLYYTLVTTLVARRQELVLKRLRTGEAPAWAIIGASTLPLLGMLAVQLVIGFGAAIVLLDLPRPTNVVLVLVAVVLGTAAWILLAVVSSGWTKTVESAQITTLPMVVVPLLFSGLSIPLSLLPDAAERVAHLLPLTPVVDLFRLGLTGRTADGTPVTLATSFAAGVAPTLVLLGWVVVGLLGARRVFRWEPRR